MSCDIESYGSLTPFVPKINTMLTEKQIKKKISKCIIKIYNANTIKKINVLDENRFENFEKKIPEIIEKEFGSIYFKSNNNETLLHLFVSDLDLTEPKNKIPYELLFKILLNKGLDPNALNDEGQNFIQKAIEAGNSLIAIKRLLNLALEYNFDINHRDIEDNTIMGKLLYEYSSLFPLHDTYKFLLENGFDANNKEKYDKNFEETIDYITDVLNKKVNDRVYLLTEYSLTLALKNMRETKDNSNQTHKNECIKINVKDLEFIKKYGIFLNNEVIPYSGILTKEIEDEIIDSLLNNKLTILYYDQNTDNNELLYTLPFMIKKYNKSKLNNRLILKTSFKEIINNCNTIGSFKGNLIVLMRICAENKVILVINDFNEIILDNMPEYDKEELKSFMEFYIENKDLILIGIANEEKECLINNFYFSNNIYTSNKDLSILHENEHLKTLINKKIKENNLIIEEELKLIIYKILLIVINDDENNERISKEEKINRLFNNIINRSSDKNIGVSKIINSFFSQSWIGYNKRCVIEELFKDIFFNKISDSDIEEKYIKTLKKLR